MRTRENCNARLVSQPDELYLNLEDILSDTSDPDIMKTFSLFLREEVKAAEERAVFRLAQKFRHKLSVEQQPLLDQAIRTMAAPVALAM